MLGMFDAPYTVVARGTKITGQTVVWLGLQNMILTLPIEAEAVDWKLYLDILSYYRKCGITGASQSRLAGS